MQLLGLGLEFLESALGINVDGILGVLSDVELGLELLWCLERGALAGDDGKVRVEGLVASQA